MPTLSGLNSCYDRSHILIAASRIASRSRSPPLMLPSETASPCPWRLRERSPAATSNAANTGSPPASRATISASTSAGG